MFINPDDRRAGNRRQRRTRAQIEQQLAQQAARRRSMSQFARLGQERNVRASRPFRNPAGIRAFAGGAPRRPGGLAEFLQDRGPGRGRDARRYIEPPVAEIPARPEPELPGMPLGGEPPIDLPQQPLGLDFIRDLMGPTQLQTALTPEIREQLMGPTRLQTALTPEIRQQLIGPQPTHPVGLDQLTGLIPLGGGTWYDPAQGAWFGPSGGLGTI